MSKAIAHGARLREIVMLGALAGLAGCPASGGGTETTDAATTTGATGTSTDAEPTSSGAVTTTTAATTGATTGVGTTGTSGTTTGTTTAGDTDGLEVCACILDDAEGGWGKPPSQPICGESVCEAVAAACEGYCGLGGEFVLKSPEALTCALTALRDRTPGIIRWSFSDAGGQNSDDGYILIGDDGTVIRRRWGAEDLAYVVSDALYGRVPDPSAFEQCLAAGSAELRFDCMREFPLGSPIVTCDDGWSDDY